MDETPEQDADDLNNEMPVTDFGTLVMSLAASALLQMGEGDDEAAQQEVPVNLALAKQTIDIIGMLGEKTRGNLTRDESQLMESVLYDLRSRYLHKK